MRSAAPRATKPGCRAGGAHDFGKPELSFASPEQSFGSRDGARGARRLGFGRPPTKFVRNGLEVGGLDGFPADGDDAVASVQEEFAARDRAFGSHPPISRFGEPNFCFGEPNFCFAGPKNWFDEANRWLGAAERWSAAAKICQREARNKRFGVNFCHGARTTSSKLAVFRSPWMKLLPVWTWLQARPTNSALQGKQTFGPAKQKFGRPKQIVGPRQQKSAMPEQTVRPGELCVRPGKLRVGPAELRVGPAELRVGPAEQQFSPGCTNLDGMKLRGRNSGCTRTCVRLGQTSAAGRAGAGPAG